MTISPPCNTGRTIAQISLASPHHSGLNDPMTSSIDLESYKETLLFLGTAGLVVPAFHRLKISPIIGFILAGIALGPFGLGQLQP
jgi:hypothetical protein